MQVVHERCCGLDVHKKTVTACIVVPGDDGMPHKQIRSFGTMADDLERLAGWLEEAEVSHVAMESTGVYWKPVWNVLEDRFELILANPQHIKPLKGRKTDFKDCEWVADFLRHGLIRPSFVPNRALRVQRSYTRSRDKLVKDRSAELQRLQDTLEEANIKLSSVVSDINGKSAREMLQALAAGQTDISAIANLAKGRLRDQMPELQRALAGRFDADLRFFLALHLAYIDFLDACIAEVEAKIGEQMAHLEEPLAALDSIPGIGITSARGILAEIGSDMSRFASAAHLASWGRMCPGNNLSAGKRRSGRTGKGNRWLRSLLTEAAHAAGRGKTYLAAQYYRIGARRGKKKAAIAVGHSILVIAYHLLSNPGMRYEDLGGRYFAERDTERLKHRLIHRLEGLGCKVTLEAA